MDIFECIVGFVDTISYSTVNLDIGVRGSSDARSPCIWTVAGSILTSGNILSWRSWK